ncbi:transposase [uncultured Gilvimarinus sp.]|uniref:transposase n=1 Tax=uncultured Gilvimarinus sp. TaxID=1689143 RepID=UPI0030D8D24A
MGLLSKPKKRKHYTCDFKRQTLALLDSGLTPAEVARQQNIRESNIYRWRREFMVHSIDAIDALRSELKRLRQENTQLKNRIKQCDKSLTEAL